MEKHVVTSVVFTDGLGEDTVQRVAGTYLAL
jgi:hypothetical protein